MSWYYRPCKRKYKDGTAYYVVVEFFPNVQGKPAWTKDAMSPYGESRKELIRDLEMMLEDCKRRRALDDTKINK